MTETQRCGFCRREMPKDGPVCGPTENSPCLCCGLRIVALVSEAAKPDKEEEAAEQE